MSQVSRRSITDIAGRCLIAALLCWPLAASAANTVLTDSFDGSEPKRGPMPGTCGDDVQLAYMDAGTFRVSASGTYSVFDVLWLGGIRHNGVDISALIYDAPFDPENPNANLVTPQGVDENALVELQSDVDYTLVVQQWCENREGAWAVSFSGPGNVISDRSAILPAFTEGTFTDNDPEAAVTDCGTGQYQQSGPVQVSTTGTYYYSDVSLWFDVDMCLQIYTAPFDPANPSANRVATNYNSSDYLDDVGTVELVADQDYYFVTQPFFRSNPISVAGEFFFVFTGPAPFRINKSLAGAWFNPDTDGQGMLLEVYDSINQLFLAWFTFDLSRPVDGTAQLGEPGHRWLTGLGPIEGSTAELKLYNTAGGVFDAFEPPAGDPQEVGSMTVEFLGCTTATVDYSLTTPPVSGQVPIQTLANDVIELCESLSKGPAEPGPL